MRFGSFLIGGLVGAAAVVYFNNKSKSMLLSAISSNKDTGSTFDKAKDSMTSAARAAAGTANGKSAGPFGMSRAFKKEDNNGVTSAEEIINRDPGLKAVVEEIVSGNQEKEPVHAQ